MTTTKFDEFFYDNELVNLQDALDFRGTLDESYGRTFLYCPYCHIARLKFFSKTTQKNAYLATWPNSQHSSDCPAQYTPEIKKELKDYYEHLSENQIQDKLNAFIRSLESREESKQSKGLSNSSTFSSISNTSSSTSRRILPQRTLSSIPHIDDNLRNIPILFHGKAYVEFELHGNFGQLNRIILKRETTKKPFLYMNNGDSAKFIPEGINENTLYNVVFIGLYETAKRFPKLIKNGSFVIISEN